MTTSIQECIQQCRDSASWPEALAFCLSSPGETPDDAVAVSGCLPGNFVADPIKKWLERYVARSLADCTGSLYAPGPNDLVCFEPRLSEIAGQAVHSVTTYPHGDEDYEESVDVFRRLWRTNYRSKAKRALADALASVEGKTQIVWYVAGQSRLSTDIVLSAFEDEARNCARAADELEEGDDELRAKLNELVENYKKLSHDLIMDKVAVAQKNKVHRMPSPPPLTDAPPAKKRKLVKPKATQFHVRCANPGCDYSLSLDDDGDPWNDDAVGSCDPNCALTRLQAETTDAKGCFAMRDPTRAEVDGNAGLHAALEDVHLRLVPGSTTKLEEIEIDWGY